MSYILTKENRIKAKRLALLEYYYFCVKPTFDCAEGERRFGVPRNVLKDFFGKNWKRHIDLDWERGDEWELGKFSKELKPKNIEGLGNIWAKVNSPTRKMSKEYFKQLRSLVKSNGNEAEISTAVDEAAGFFYYDSQKKIAQRNGLDFIAAKPTERNGKRIWTSLNGMKKEKRAKLILRPGHHNVSIDITASFLQFAMLKMDEDNMGVYHRMLRSLPKVLACFDSKQDRLEYFGKWFNYEAKIGYDQKLIQVCNQDGWSNFRDWLRINAVNKYKGTTLQTTFTLMEQNLMMTAGRLLHEEKIPFVNIHDCLMVSSIDKNRAHNILYKVFNSLWGLKISFKTFVTSVFKTKSLVSIREDMDTNREILSCTIYKGSNNSHFNNYPSSCSKWVKDKRLNEPIRRKGLLLTKDFLDRAEKIGFEVKHLTFP